MFHRRCLAKLPYEMLMSEKEQNPETCIIIESLTNNISQYGYIGDLGVVVSLTIKLLTIYWVNIFSNCLTWQFFLLSSEVWWDI